MALRVLILLPNLKSGRTESEIKWETVFQIPVISKE
jgi:hypothetical protein